MTGNKIISAFVFAIVGVFVMFDVDFVFDIKAPAQADVPDPVVEAAYANCYAEKDGEIHTTAFGTIDNPEVQKEYINSNRDRAAAECRALYPESTITIDEPGHFNLVDLTPRFW